MPHISLPEGFPGITGGFAFRPETAGPLRELAETLLRAAFCMFNRYVDGLATWAPTDQALYHAMGRRIAHDGYVRRSE
jgi:hypothetical protein